jgi:hypothetical protein
MTDSDTLTGRPPDNPPPGQEWMPYPGAGYYEFSHRGKARSVDRTIGGKFYPGKELATRLNNQGYVLVDIRLDDGTKKTVTMHSGVLRSHDRDPEAWEECCHGPGGPQDNRWPENIQWGTRGRNLADMAAARPPRPERTCPRCGMGHRGRARNCPDCMTAMGVAAAGELAGGKMLDQVADDLDYPPAGVYRLAVTKGGLHVHAGPCPRLVVVEEELNAAARAAGHTGSWLRRVINRREASRRNSDAQ